MAPWQRRSAVTPLPRVSPGSARGRSVGGCCRRAVGAVEAEEGPQAQKEQHRERTRHLARAHLRQAGAAVLEHDGGLTDPRTRLAAAIQRLLMDRVSRKSVG